MAEPIECTDMSYTEDTLFLEHPVTMKTKQISNSMVICLVMIINVSFALKFSISVASNCCFIISSTNSVLRMLNNFAIPPNIFGSRF